MSDLLQVGAHCSLSSCNVNDFLPITCKCTQIFCREHIFPDAHNCTAISTFERSQGGAETEKLRRCDIEGCSKPTLFAFTTKPDRETCEKCRKAFCVDHRYPDTHSCTVSPEDASPSAPSTARALLEKNFGSNLAASSSRASTPRASSYPKRKPPSDPVKLAQYLKVQLMKMKHSAVPADPKDTPTSVPQSMRLVVGVLYEGKEKVFWFKNTVSTGRAVDLLSSHFKIPSSKAISLVKPSPPEDVILHNDQTLAGQVQDGEVLRINVASD